MTKTDQKNQSKKPENAVTTTGGGAIAEQMPDFMRKFAGQGTENLGSGDYEMPRIKLMQGLSEEIQAFDGVKSGDFFHALAEVSLGSKLRIVPLFISKRYVLWRPRHDGGGILARADDAVNWQPSQGEFEVKAYKDRDVRVKWKLAPTVAKSKLAAWGTYDPADPKSQPAATEVYVYVVALPDYPEHSPVALMLQRTAITPAKKFNGKMKISSAPIFGRVFEMESFIDDRNGQKFNNYRFTSVGFVQDEEELKRYEALHRQFQTSGVKIKDEEGAQDDETPVARDDTNAKDEQKY